MTEALTEERTALGWQMLEPMMLIRRFEEAVCTLANEKAFPGHFHLYTGQDATGVGAMAALRPQDRIATTHRNHGHVLARGTDPCAALAEIMGRETGLNRGRGGTIHLCDPDLGFIQTSGIVGSVIGLAVGAAYACQLKGDGAVTAAFFGDGALEEGIGFETLNIAALWKLPIVFICENNSAEAWGAAKGGFPTLVHAAHDLRSIPGSMGIEAVRVEGIDAFAVYEAVVTAVERCRTGTGPIFIEAMTKRWAGSAPLWPELATGITDIAMATGETPIGDGPHRAWFEDNDPLLRLARQLAPTSDDASGRIHAIDRAATARIADAVAFARASAFPAASTVADYVFA